MLSRFTQARIGLGHSGAGLPTRAILEFREDHARARDAIHTPLDTALMQSQLLSAGFSSRIAHSRARTRAEYLRRPDLGRRLAEEDIARLQEEDENTSHRLTVVVADGLSSTAALDHAVPMLDTLRPLLTDWSLDDIVVATQARVALADEIGELRKAEMAIILIGERPGLRSANSLGAYLTWKPRVGRTDAERNCISNIRLEGLSYQHAAEKMAYLLRGARELQATGVRLKDNSDLPALQAGEKTLDITAK